MGDNVIAHMLSHAKNNNDEDLSTVMNEYRRVTCRFDSQYAQ